MNRSRKTGDLVSQNNLFVDIANDRIGIGSTVPGNKLSLPDSAKIGLGNAEDLTLFHDGSNSYITNSTGQLVLKTPDNSVAISLTDANTVFNDDAKFNSTVYVSEDIAHTGDANTKITFPSAGDTITAQTGGTERLRITSGGKVQIGTSTGRIINSHAPRLQVSGTDYSTSTVSLVNNAADATGAYLFFTKQRSGSAGGSTAVAQDDIIGDIRFTAGDGTDVETGAARITVVAESNASSNSVPSYMRFSTTSTTTPVERLRIDSSGRLLVGTTTEGWDEADDLTIATTGHTGITIRSGTSSEGNIAFSDATSGTAEYAGLIRYAQSDNSMRIFTASTERVRIASDGSFAVGTTSPDSALHVYKQINDRTARFQRLSGQHLDITQTAGINSFLSTGKNFEIGTTDSQDVIFDTAGSERLRIDSSGVVRIANTNFSAAGNADELVIGTTSGNRGLTIVSGNTNIGALFFADDGDTNIGSLVYEHNTNQMRMNVAGAQIMRLDYTSSIPTWIIGGDLNTHISLPSADTFAFTTGGTERLRITSTGGVGIGTDAPATPLHIQAVNPTIRLTDSNQAADNKNWIIAGGNTQILRVQALNDAGTGGGSLFDFYRSGNNINEFRGMKGGNTWFVVDNLNKQVGINTDNPASKLTVWADDSDTDTDVFQIRGKTGAFNIRVNDADASNPEWAIRTYSSEPIVFMQGTTERARISSAGLVGIGSDAPEVPLVVQGGTGNTPILARSTDTRSQIAFMDNATSGVGHVAVGCEGSSLFIRTGTGGKALTIDTAGRLLLGTTSSRQTRLATNNFSPSMQLESDTVASFSMTRWQTGVNPSRLVLQKGRGTIASPAVVADGDQTGQILFNAWDGDTFTNTAQIRSVVDGTPGDDQMPGMLVFATNSGGTATTTRMTIKADGKIGINVTVPTTNLQIGSTTVDSDNVITLGKRVSSSETNLPKIGQHSDNGASSSLALCATSSSGKIHFFTGNGGSGFGASSNAERMVITSDGQIGVNKSSPKTWNTSYTSLQIHDAGYIAGSTDDSFVAIGANNYLDTGGNYDYTNSDFASQLYQVNGELVFRNAASGTADNAITWAERLRITSAGNVDITSGYLTISNDIKSSDDDFYVYSYKGGSDGQTRSGIQFDGTNGRLRFHTATNEVLRIDSSGNVNLMTSTQNAYVGFKANNTAINFTLGSTAGTSPRMYFYGTGNGQSSAGDIFMGSGTGGILHFRSAESIKFEVNSDNTTAEALNISSSAVVAVNVVMRANDGFVSDTNLILNSDHNGNNSTNNDIIFQNRGNELARLKGTGFFGIGTASPSSELHVFDNSGDVAATIETTGSGKDARLNLYAHNTGVSQIRLGDDTDTNIGRITYYHAASGTNEANSLEFITGDASRVRVASTGLVLPQTNNEIRTDSSDGSDNKRIILAAGGDNSQSRGAQIAMYGNEYSSHEGRLQLLAGNSGNANGVIQMHTGGLERLRIKSNGQVYVGGSQNSSAIFGVGMNDDTVLSDSGGLYNSSATNFIEVNNTGDGITGKESGILLRTRTSGAGVWAIYNKRIGTYNSDLVFRTRSGASANAERLRLTNAGNLTLSDGNMGIRTAPNSSYYIDILNATSSRGMRIKSTGNQYHDLVFDANRTNAANALGRIVGKWNGNNVAMIQVQTGDDTSNKDDGRIRFYTSESGSSVLERMEIRNNGTVNIGGANEVQLDATNDEILYLHGAVVGANVDFAYGMRIDLDDDNTGTTSSDRERGCAMFQFSGNCTGGDTSNETRIWNIYSDVNCNEDYDNVYGLYADCKTTHSVGTVSEMRGVYGLVQNADSGNVSNMTGLYGLVQSTTGANSETVNDMVGVRGRVNMCAGSSTANATDVVAVWGNIDNDNNTAQASGGKCALFYGSYDKTTGLSNPHGVDIASDVPNYFAGQVNIGDKTLNASENGALNVYTTTSGGKAQFVHAAGTGGLRLAGTGSGSGSNLVFANDYNSGTFSDHWTLTHNGSDDSFRFLSGGTGGTERLRITSTGTLQLGGVTDNSGDIDANHTKLTIKQTANGREDGLYIERHNERKGYYMWINSSGGAGDALCFARNSNGTKEDIMCLDRDGNTFIGGTSRGQDTTSSNLSVYGNSSNTTANIPASFHCANVSSTRYLQSFCNSNGVVGSIRVNGTQTYFNTSSDYRLKENITPLTDVFTRLNALKPCRFNFKSDPSKTLDGFIAHEVEEVVPHAVAGEKDGMKPITFYEEGDTLPDGKEVGDGKTYSTTEIEPQQLDDSKLIPLLTAALQESVTEIENLKTKNSQLTTLLDELKVRLDNAGL